MGNKLKNHDDQLVFIIKRFNEIEQNITEIIAREIGAPKEKRGFISVLLNTAITSFGSKVKLFLHLRASNGWAPIEEDRLHKLMRIRNQFAHCVPVFHIHITTDNEMENANVTEFLMLESVTNKGALVPTESDKAFREFTECSSYLRKYFSDLYKKTPELPPSSFTFSDAPTLPES